jgi:hypothetical protein
MRKINPIQRQNKEYPDRANPKLRAPTKVTTSPSCPGRSSKGTFPDRSRKLIIYLRPNFRSLTLIKLPSLDHIVKMAARQPNPTGSRKISFNVSEQYDIQDVVGEGAYGVVWYVYAVHCPCTMLSSMTI